MSKTLEEKREYARKWRIAHPGYMTQKSREFLKNNPSYLVGKTFPSTRKHALKKYRITEEEYKKILTDQNGNCALCQKPKGMRNLSVDHNHTTGAVRGLLHSSCNVGIGFFKEDVELLKLAILYLERNV